MIGNNNEIQASRRKKFVKIWKIWGKYAFQQIVQNEYYKSQPQSMARWNKVIKFEEEELNMCPPQLLPFYPLHQSQQKQKLDE